MKRRSIALCDDDEKYIVKLQESLEQKENFPFSVNTYTGVDRLKESLTDTDYELILAEEKAFDELKKDLMKDKDKHSLILLKERGSINDSNDFIWKYQSAEKIRKDILKICAEKGDPDVIFGSAEGRTRMIGIFSPVGRDIQTSFSLLLGQFLAKKKKVLYLNLEPFSGLSNMPGYDPESDLTDLIYYLESGKEKIRCKLESMVGNIGGLDYVSPAFSFLDLSQISESNWLLLLQTIINTGKYDYLIVDLSEMIKGLLSILRECDVVYTITGREGLAPARMKQYEELLRQQEGNDILEHTRKVEMPTFSMLPSDLMELPYSELAGYVGEIAEAELECR
ncbi:MAG: hypothetical protein K6C99_08165 [Lachnospiraceae bacterium]|nr:hypothetical protein [Lachnospiraceae bacterium]